ncbi:hypothetical protein [Olleya sp. Bg11-27]|uniref:hypothetical protein n=1 Tax=Olleya sp. Bg11-27 TaxID=2058135 RepID=UPI0012FD0895|nr:hypothetical protein [Olleya sp. Bg11-27]
MYTIANINATEGFVFGGSAGGWMLYTKRMLSSLNTYQSLTVLHMLGALPLVLV